MTDCEATEIEAKAIMCIRQGQANPKCTGAAGRFVELAVQRLLDNGRYEEAKKVLDTNAN